MKKIFLNLLLLILANFSDVCAQDFLEVYVHPDYNRPGNNTSFDHLLDNPDVKTVSIIGLHGNYKSDPISISFEDLLLLPQLEHLVLSSGIYNRHRRGPEESRQPQLSEEQWNVIKSCPIKDLTLYLDHFGGIPLDSLNDSETLKHLTVHFPINAHLPATFLDEALTELNELSGIHLSLSGGFPNIESLNLLNSLESLDLQILYRDYNTVFYSSFGKTAVEQLNYVHLPRLKLLKINSEGIKGLRVDLLAPNLEHLDLTDSDITGSTVSSLKSLSSLKEVYLGQSKYNYTHVNGSLTSGAVQNLSKIPTLRKISLTGNKIKGADFSVFTRLEDLELLDISGTDISRNDLLTLHDLKQLKELKIALLRSTTIRTEDINALKEALPNCNIIQ